MNNISIIALIAGILFFMASIAFIFLTINNINCLYRRIDFLEGELVKQETRDVE
jgi:hypothetical protein